MGNSFLAVSLVAVWVDIAKVLRPPIAVKVNTSPTRKRGKSVHLPRLHSAQKNRRLGWWGSTNLQPAKEYSAAVSDNGWGAMSYSSSSSSPAERVSYRG
jgi:hypothetical protein